MPAAESREVQSGPIRIDWNEDGSVDVVGKDRHRFLMTMQQAADACARGKEQLVWKSEFDGVTARVHKWSEGYSHLISAAYVTYHEGHVVFFVVPKGGEMNFELSDLIAELAIELYHDFANCHCELRQIPGESRETLETFLDLSNALVIYGDPPATSEAMGA